MLKTRIYLIILGNKIHYLRLLGNIAPMDAKLLRGSLDTIIISLLEGGGEMYGYEVTKKVEALTKGEIVLTEGALYPALHRLEGKGLLETETRKVGNRFRKYYRLTKKGKKESVGIIEEMKSYLSIMDNVIHTKLA